MSSKTTNYNLIKPAETDYYNIKNNNDNMDLIDAALKDLEEKKATRVTLEAVKNTVSDLTKNKADKTEIPKIPASLPANGGNADTLGGVGIDKLCKVSTVALDNKDLNTAVIEHNTWYSYTTTTLNAPNNGYGIIQRTNTGNNNWLYDTAYSTGGVRYERYKINNDEWSNWSTGDATTLNGKHAYELSQKAYLVANNVDLFEYIESLTDEQLPPHSTVTIRAFNCKKSPVDGYPLPVEYSSSNGGDFIIDVTRLEYKDWYTLLAKEIPTNKIYRCIKHNNVWQPWRPIGDIIDLPVGTNIFDSPYVNTIMEWFTVKTYRIAHSKSAPLNFGYAPNNNDFYYTVYKMSNTWMRIVAMDVWTNRTFINTCNNGNWVGWQSVADITTLVTFTNSRYVSASEYTCIKLGNYLVCTAKITVQNITSTGWVPLLQFPSGMTAYKNSSFALTNFNTIIRDGFVTNNEIRGHMNTSDNGKFFTGSFIAQLK